MYRGFIFEMKMGSLREQVLCNSFLGIISKSTRISANVMVDVKWAEEVYNGLQSTLNRSTQTQKKYCIDTLIFCIQKWI